MTRTWIRIVGLLACFGAGGVWAQGFPFNGIVSPASPQMPVVIISTPNCASQGATLVHYDVQPFYVRTSGIYQISLTDPLNETAFYVNSPTFDPASPFTTCVAASNSNPILFNVNLTANVPYFGVTTNDTFAQTQTIPYTLNITGPGAVVLGTPEALQLPVASTWALLALMAAMLVLAARAHRRRFTG